MRFHTLPHIFHINCDEILLKLTAMVWLLNKIVAGGRINANAIYVQSGVKLSNAFKIDVL